MWKQRTLYALALASAAVSYILADQKSLLILLGILLVLPLLSLLLQYLAMRGLTISETSGNNSRMGQNVLICFHMIRKNRVPFGTLHIPLTLRNVLFGETTETVLTLLIDTRKQADFNYACPTLDCGEIRMTAERFECRDLLGLFCWKKTFSAESRIVIYPPELKLTTEISLRPAAKNFGELYDPRKKGQDVSEVSALRDYMDGDAISSIHWKLSGKLDRLIVKEFGYPSSYSTLILYETAKFRDESPMPHSCLNAVLGLTAALSESLLRKNLAHDVGRCMDGILHTLPVNSVHSHENMVSHMLNTPFLQSAQPDSLLTLLSEQSSRNGYTKVIYITPVYEEQRVRELSETTDLTVVYVSDKRIPDYEAVIGYMLIPVSAEDYQETVHNFVI